MNGRQMADAGRLSRPGLKVLFITGYAGERGPNHGHLATGMQVLTKPFSLDTLAARIRSLIEAEAGSVRRRHGAAEALVHERLAVRPLRQGLGDGCSRQASRWGFMQSRIAALRSGPVRLRLSTCARHCARAEAAAARPPARGSPGQAGEGRGGEARTEEGLMGCSRMAAPRGRERHDAADLHPPDGGFVSAL